jgi:two-component system, NarL family, invasion response regulator UvrY
MLPMIRVLIVDDHAIFREGVKKVLSTTSDIQVADEAGDGRVALRMMTENSYDLVLLDLAIPGIHGLDVLRAIKSIKHDLPILVLSIYPEEQYALRVLKEGAAGYLTKESVPSDLVRAIRKAAQGGKYVSDFLGERLADQIVSDKEKQPHDTLSSKEYQVFQLIANGKSVKEIARDLSLARTTISTYRSRILSKLDLKSNAQLVRYAVERNLVF